MYGIIGRVSTGIQVRLIQSGIHFIEVDEPTVNMMEYCIGVDLSMNFM